MPGINEPETKILEINKQEVIARLKELGVGGGVPLSICDRYYNIPDSVKMLRIRVQNNKPTVTCKYGETITGTLKSQVATVKELETEIGDARILNEIFERIGHSCFVEIEKTKIVFELNGVKVEIRELFKGGNRIPTYIELESSHGDPEGKLFEEVIELLGLEHHERSIENSKQLLKRYGIE